MPLTIRIGPATGAERDLLRAPIEPAMVAASLTGWCLVACRVTVAGIDTYDVALFGHIAPAAPGAPWRSRLTSSVLAFDQLHGLVRTVRSLYTVGGPERTPDAREMDRIGATMAADIVRRLRATPSR